MEVSFVVSAYEPSQYPPPHLPEVAFAGKSNVGKSSLINKLVNRRNLAITSAKPGRTRSINFFMAAKAVYLVDLPGYGFARVPKAVKKSWKNMVESYLESRPNLKGVILILDIRRNPDPDDLSLFGWLKHHGIPVVTVLTKADKVSRQKVLNRVSETRRILNDVIELEPIAFSARTGTGRAQLWEQIEDLVGDLPTVPPQVRMP